MICVPCRHKQHEQCDNLYGKTGLPRDEPTKTWCDCEHRTNTTYLDQSNCKHLNWEDTMLYCPSCGKVLDDSDDNNREAPSIPDVVRQNKAREAQALSKDGINPCYCSDTNPAGTCVNCANAPKPTGDEETPGRQRDIASERHPETPSR